MFNVVLKNTILISMIIVIIYYLLKSQILTVSQYRGIKKVDDDKRWDYKITDKKVPDKVSYSLPERTKQSDDNMKELYAFVFEDTEAKDGLNKYFKEGDVNQTCVNSADKSISCENNNFSTPAKTLCPSTITKHHELMDKKQIKNGGIVAVPQSCINEVLAEYENESEMSGATVMGGFASGYDTFNSQFQTL